MNLDEMIAAAEQRQQAAKANNANGPTGTELASILVAVFGHDVIGELEALQISQSEPVADFLYHGTSYTLMVAVVGYILTRHDPPVESGQRPRPYSQYHAHWPATTPTPGRDWLLVAVSRLHKAAHKEQSS